MTWSIEKTKSNNSSYKWPNSIIEWEWPENHILANIFSKNRVGVQKCQIISPPPISGNVINQILYLETPGNNSRHVDKCCTAGLGNSLNMALFWWLLLYYLFSVIRWANKVTTVQNMELFWLIRSENYKRCDNPFFCRWRKTIDRKTSYTAPDWEIRFKVSFFVHYFPLKTK